MGTLLLFTFIVDNALSKPVTFKLLLFINLDNCSIIILSLIFYFTTVRNPPS